MDITGFKSLKWAMIGRDWLFMGWKWSAFRHAKDEQNAVCIFAFNITFTVL